MEIVEPRAWWQHLEALAPLHLAGDWDHVGLLVEPTRLRETRRVLLAIDLTEPVLDEALAHDCDGIVAYHPPIFGGLPRLTQADVKQRIVLRAVEAGVWIHSPHTALDAAHGGVNDWLADGFEGSHREALEPSVDEPTPVGQGRLITLTESLSLDAAVERIRAHLKLAHVQLATAPAHGDGRPLRTVALCAGAGGSVLERAPHADLWWTGEMRHHDVLAATARGTSVVLCHHTNTERGYLPVLAARLQELCPDVECLVSRVDADPLQIV